MTSAGAAVRPRAARGVMRRRRPLVPIPHWPEALLVLGAYGALAVLMTWPLAAEMGTRIAGGGIGGDQSGYVWDLWFNANHGLSFWGSRVQEMISAPFGRPSPSSVNVTLFTTVGPGWVVAKLFSAVAAYNVVVLSGLALSGAAMYLLIRWLGVGVGPAGWAGAAYMVCPYVQLKASGHIPLAHVWVFPLLVIAGVRWIERPSLRRSGWLVAALGASWLTNPYYGAMGLVIVAVIALVALARAWRRGGGWRPVLTGIGGVAGLSVAFIAVPLALLGSSAQDAIDSSLQRSKIELELYGARLSDYVLPSAQSPFFDGITPGDLWAGVGSPGGERMAFLGYGTMLLALVGLAVTARRGLTMTPRVRIAVGIAAAAVPVLVVFSLASPTRWFGAEIPMPSSLVYEALPYLRVYGRFAVAVMAVVLVLAAVGLFALVRGRTATTVVAVLSTAFVVSAVELPVGAPQWPLISSAPPVLVNGVPPEEVPTWTWIRDNTPEDAIVYEQPGLPNEGVERFFMYGQLVHGRRITNGSMLVGSIASDFMTAFGDVTRPGVARRLARLGISHVTINPWAYGMVGLTPPNPAAPPPGFEVARGFADGSAVWRVTAAPAGAVAIPRLEGWWDPELIDGVIWRYMAERARVTVVAPAAGAYRVAFRARGWRHERGERYRVRMRGPGGAVRSVSVGAEREVVLDLRLRAGRNEIVLTSDRPARTIGGGDLRRVTVQMSDWSVIRPGAR